MVSSTGFAAFDCPINVKMPPLEQVEPSRVSCTLGFLWVGRLAGHVLLIVDGFCFDRWDASEPVHQSFLVEPSHVVQGHDFNVADVA